MCRENFISYNLTYIMCLYYTYRIFTNLHTKYNVTFWIQGIYFKRVVFYSYACIQNVIYKIQALLGHSTQKFQTYIHKSYTFIQFMVFWGIRVNHHTISSHIYSQSHIRIMVHICMNVRIYCIFAKATSQQASLHSQQNTKTQYTYIYII